MELSTRRANQYTQELTWVITELTCISPLLNRNKDGYNSIKECIERLQYLYANLTKQTEKGKKDVKPIYKKEKGTGKITNGIL